MSKSINFWCQTSQVGRKNGRLDEFVQLWDDGWHSLPNSLAALWLWTDNICQQWRIQGGGGDGATTPLVWPCMLANFCIVFASFISRLNREVLVSRLLPFKNCVKMHPNFGDKLWFFSGEGPSPSTTPLDAYGASPLLTKMLNPLFVSAMTVNWCRAFALNLASFFESLPWFFSIMTVIFV